jgi:hypothetical protein
MHSIFSRLARSPVAQAVLPLACVVSVGFFSAYAPSSLAEHAKQATAQEDPVDYDLSKLNFARIEYDSVGGYGQAYYAFEGRYWERWETDYPQAERNLAKRLAELSRIETGKVPSRRRLTSPDLADFPMIFMSDVGYSTWSAEEVEALQIYLGNGGFLWADDFWGDAEWAAFERLMRKVLPGNQWIVVPNEHPIFSTVFEIPEMPQIPAESFAGYRGRTAEPAFAHRYPAGSLDRATMRGFFDEDGRLMVIGTHNTDVADGWEREAYGQWYFEHFSTQSYRVAVNVLTYVMTH